MTTIGVTVTFLQMDKPLATRPASPMNVPLALLRTRAMPRHYYRYLIDRVGRQWHWVNGLRLSDDVLDARLAEAQRDIRVLYLDGSPAGMFEVAPHEGNLAEIVYVGLMPHATGRGLGRFLLGAAIESAWALRPEAVILQTCTLDHPAALPLYQKLGFVPVGQARDTIHPFTDEERAAILVGG